MVAKRMTATYSAGWRGIRAPAATPSVSSPSTSIPVREATASLSKVSPSPYTGPNAPTETESMIAASKATPPIQSEADRRSSKLRFRPKARS